MCSYDKKIQSHVAILDFSHAFDTVPHKRLLGKLDHYGVRGKIQEWIPAFLCNRHMWVAVDGETSQMCKVVSGVPQGTVLGLLLFLLFINDLPNQVSPGTTTRLFANDCLAYRELSRMVTRGSSKVIWRHLAHGQKNGECVSTRPNAISYASI